MNLVVSGDHDVVEVDVHGNTGAARVVHGCPSPR
jgi:hypothetical protein